MKLPKKLKACHKTNSFIVDENGTDTLLVYNNSKEFRAEIVKRYNDYNLLKVYVVGLGLTVLTLMYILCTRETI